GDWWNYLDTFKYIALSDFQTALSQTEFGYALLNWIAAQLGWGIWFPNLVCAAILVWGLVTLCKQQPNPSLALVVAVPYLVIGVGMGFTRQSAALGFVMLALVDAVHRRNLRVLLYLALGATFHTSTLVMVPLIGLSLVRRSTGMLFALGLLGIVLAVQFWDHIANQMVIYETYDITSHGAVPRLLMNVVPALVLLAYRKRFSASADELRLWTILAIITLFTVVLMFVVDSTAIVDRLGVYLVPLQIFVLSRVPTAFGTRHRQNLLLLTLIIVYSLTVELVWLNFSSWSSRAWIPYQNYIWDWGPGGRRPGR
ncbi:MAG TPA: EpsG family protein, partial [Sphingomicrobium sp.]|nr:EpsG family protein [Sphingomicrobium sp.]